MTPASMTAVTATLLAVLVLYSPQQALGATTYYLSVNGSDSAAGTSPDAPWRSLNKTATLSLGEGDAILLQRGSIWYDEVMTLTYPEGLLLSAYGNESLPRPAITTSRPATSKLISCVQMMNPNNTHISSLRIAGCYTGLDLIFTPNATRGNMTIEDCFFHDIRQPYGAYQPSGGSWAQSIAVTGTGGAMSVRNITIRNNLGNRLDTFFSSPGFVDGLLLAENTVAQCGYNCYGMSGNNMLMRDSVFLRDTSPGLFLYGTTDIIVGTVTGNNAIQDCDFNQRGEFEAAPDGCALDFETSATGFSVLRNTFYRSWGAGIMVFGHDTTSHDLVIADNVFIKAGCVQPRNDQGGIAFMCPGHHQPSGSVLNNSFVTCPGVDAFFNSYPGCDGNMTFSGNLINGNLTYVEEPQVSFEPPSPTSTDPFVKVPILVFCRTPNVTIRYTMDGSRPTEDSPVVPQDGVITTWPGPSFAFNARAFHPSMLPSVTNGVIVERYGYKPRGQGDYIRSSFDGISVNATTVEVDGWAVDPALPGGGKPPVDVQIRVDQRVIMTVVANYPRPDLVKAKVAPNPDHGFKTQLPPAVVKELQSGKHMIDVFVVDSPGSVTPHRLDASPVCVCSGLNCPC